MVQLGKWVYFYNSFIGFELYEIKVRKTIFLAIKVTFCNFNSQKLGESEMKWAENLTLSTVWDADVNRQEAQIK